MLTASSLRATDRWRASSHHPSGGVRADSQISNKMAYKTKLPVQYAPHITTNIRTGVKKVTAHLVEKETYNIDMLAVEIATATTVTRPDVKAVIDAFVDISMRHLCEGHRVELGSLGKLFPTLKTTPVQYLEDVEQSITALKARFRPGEQLQENMKGASFVMVAPKASQGEALETKKEAIYAVIGRKPAPEPEP